MDLLFHCDPFQLIFMNSIYLYTNTTDNSPVTKHNKTNNCIKLIFDYLAELPFWFATIFGVYINNSIRFKIGCYMVRTICTSVVFRDFILFGYLANIRFSSVLCPALINCRFAHTKTNWLIGHKWNRSWSRMFLRAILIFIRINCWFWLFGIATKMSEYQSSKLLLWWYRRMFRLRYETFSIRSVRTKTRRKYGFRISTCELAAPFCTATDYFRNQYAHSDQISDSHQ